MPTKPASAPDRLRLLLSWLNGELDPQRDVTAIRRAATAFLESFDGSEGAGHVEVEAPQELTIEELFEVDDVLLLLLEQGFGDPTLQEASFPVTSLRIAVRSANRSKPRRRSTPGGALVVDGGIAAKRAWAAAGAYVLRVSGSPGELLPFLILHLLTQADMVAVKRCRRRGHVGFVDCPKFFIVAPGARGKPQQFCSHMCVLLNAEQKAIAAAKRRQMKMK